MIGWRWSRALVAGLFVATSVCAVEANDTFDTAMVLPPGMLSVTDSLTPGTVRYPDTRLGIRTSTGSIGLVDDDGSIFGNGFASGLSGVPMPSGDVWFAVTGFGDSFFSGGHTEAGPFRVHVDVYNSLGAPLSSFNEERSLQPGLVQDFSFANDAWSGGIYNVNIDNMIDVPAGGDVDFFTFTGLSPGASFTAQTFDPTASEIDTFLGWFDEGGLLLATDDDSGGGFLSLLEGTVPASGELTFAVTGFGDELFVGTHTEQGTYDLRVSIDAAPLPGDHNQDGKVDAADYTVWRDGLGGPFDEGDYNVWRQNFGVTIGAASLPGDYNHDGRIAAADYTVWRDGLGGPFDEGDYNVWRQNFGAIAGASTVSAAVPEPSAVTLVCLAIVGLLVRPLASHRILV